MRDIIQLPNNPLKLFITPNNNFNRWYASNKQAPCLDNFSFEDDLVFDFFSGKDIYFKSADGLHTFSLTKADFSKLLKSNAPNFLHGKLTFTCRFMFVTRWDYLYIKPLGI